MSAISSHFIQMSQNNIVFVIYSQSHMPVKLKLQDTRVGPTPGHNNLNASTICTVPENERYSYNTYRVGQKTAHQTHVHNSVKS